MYVFYNNDLFLYVFVGPTCQINLYTIIYIVEKMIRSSRLKEITGCKFESIVDTFEKLENVIHHQK